MKHAISFVISVVFAMSQSTSFAGQKYYETVSISGKDNCAIYGTRKWDQKSAKLELPKGNYIIKPIGGAMSPWRNDLIGKECCAEEPWMWYAIIDVNGNKHVLGRLIKFATEREAFSDNSDEEIRIKLPETTLIKFGTEDISQGKDYCGDNRGTETIGIIKVELP